MSSNIKKLVPEFTGFSYKIWSNAMKMFLMSQDVWETCKPGVHPTIGGVIPGTGPPTTASTFDWGEVGKWEEKEECAMGMICL